MCFRLCCYLWTGIRKIGWIPEEQYFSSFEQAYPWTNNYQVNKEDTRTTSMDFPLVSLLLNVSIYYLNFSEVSLAPCQIFDGIFCKESLSMTQQKGEFYNGGNKKAKHTKFSKKNPNISHPLISTRMYEYQGVRNVRFFGKFSVLCFLVTSVLRCALLPYYRWVYGKILLTIV